MPESLERSCRAVRKGVWVKNDQTDVEILLSCKRGLSCDGKVVGTIEKAA